MQMVGHHHVPPDINPMAHAPCSKPLKGIVNGWHRQSCPSSVSTGCQEVNGTVAMKPLQALQAHWSILADSSFSMAGLSGVRPVAAVSPPPGFQHPVVSPVFRLCSAGPGPRPAVLPGKDVLGPCQCIPTGGRRATIAAQKPALRPTREGLELPQG